MISDADFEANGETDGGALQWRDGDMPYSPAFGDHFYSQADGRLECAHVFLAGNRLPERWPTEGTFSIGELGFGTGLNLCETWHQWRAADRQSARLHFISFERYPMQAAELERALSHWPEIEAERQALVASWPREPSGTLDIALADDVRLTVVCGDALEMVSRSTEAFDAWFLDGFAPSRNPDMWSLPLMQAVFDRTRPGGTCSTYSAAGFVRRNLQAAGFTVQRLPGFAGKREMLGGSKPGSAA